MANYPHIERYRQHLDELREFGGFSEQHLRPAFQNCLDSYCRDRKERLMLVPELAIPSGVRPGRDCEGLPENGTRLLGGQGHERRPGRRDSEKVSTAVIPRDKHCFLKTLRPPCLSKTARLPCGWTCADLANCTVSSRHFLDYELPEIEEFRKARESGSRKTCPPFSKNLRGND